MRKEKWQCIACGMIQQVNHCTDSYCILKRDCITWSREAEEAYRYGNGDINKAAQYLKDNYFKVDTIEGIRIWLSPKMDENRNWIKFETMKRIG